MNPKIDQYNNKFWYQDGKLHRLDGPAIEWTNGFSRKEWYQNGQLHRLDGPAVEYADGYKEWWKNGLLYNSKEEWFMALSKKDKFKMIWELD